MFFVSLVARRRSLSGSDRKPRSGSVSRDPARHGPDDLARRLLDQLFEQDIADREGELIKEQARVAAARRALADARRQQQAWFREGSFDHRLGVRAVLLARIADMHDRTQPPGRHLAAMVGFLKTHHPPAGSVSSAAEGRPDRVE